MTDEKRLHEMMADPGPAPTHDGNGWIRTVSTAGGGFTVGQFVSFEYHGGLVLGVIEGIEPDGRLLVDCGGPVGRQAVPASECQPSGPPIGALPEDSAGPAPSCASASGTGGPAGGLDGLLARLEADAAAIRRAAEEIESRRRELWDARELILARRAGTEVAR